MFEIDLTHKTVFQDGILNHILVIPLAFIILFSDGGQNMGIEVFYIQRFEQLDIPKAVFTSGRQERLGQLRLHFFVLENLTDICRFHGF